MDSASVRHWLEAATNHPLRRRWLMIHSWLIPIWLSKHRPLMLYVNPCLPVHIDNLEFILDTACSSIYTDVGRRTTRKIYDCNPANENEWIWSCANAAAFNLEWEIYRNLKVIQRKDRILHQCQRGCNYERLQKRTLNREKLPSKRKRSNVDIDKRKAKRKLAVDIHEGWTWRLGSQDCRHPYMSSFSLRLSVHRIDIGCKATLKVKQRLYVQLITIGTCRSKLIAAQATQTPNSKALKDILWSRCSWDAFRDSFIVDDVTWKFKSFTVDIIRFKVTF